MNDLWSFLLLEQKSEMLVGFEKQVVLIGVKWKWLRVGLNDKSVLMEKNLSFRTAFIEWWNTHTVQGRHSTRNLFLLLIWNKIHVMVFWVMTPNHYTVSTQKTMTWIFITMKIWSLEIKYSQQSIKFKKYFIYRFSWW